MILPSSFEKEELPVHHEGEESFTPGSDFLRSRLQDYRSFWIMKVQGEFI